MLWIRVCSHTTKHFVQDHSKRKHIGLMRVVFSAQYLRSHVRGCPNASSAALSLLEESGYTEISDFACPCLIDEQVIRLQISVDQIFNVQVSYAESSTGSQMESHLSTDVLSFLCHQIMHT